MGPRRVRGWEFQGPINAAQVAWLDDEHFDWDFDCEALRGTISCNAIPRKELSLTSVGGRVTGAQIELRSIDSLHIHAVDGAVVHGTLQHASLSPQAVDDRHIRHVSCSKISGIENLLVQIDVESIAGVAAVSAIPDRAFRMVPGRSGFSLSRATGNLLDCLSLTKALAPRCVKSNQIVSAPANRISGSLNGRTFRNIPSRAISCVNGQCVIGDVNLNNVQCVAARADSTKSRYVKAGRVRGRNHKYKLLCAVSVKIASKLTTFSTKSVHLNLKSLVCAHLSSYHARAAELHTSVSAKSGSVALGRCTARKLVIEGRASSQRACVDFMNVKDSTRTQGLLASRVQAAQVMTSNSVVSQSTVCNTTKVCGNAGITSTRLSVGSGIQGTALTAVSVDASTSHAKVDHCTSSQGRTNSMTVRGSVDTVNAQSQTIACRQYSTKQMRVATGMYVSLGATAFMLNANTLLCPSIHVNRSVSSSTFHAHKCTTERLSCTSAAAEHIDGKQWTCSTAHSSRLVCQDLACSDVKCMALTARTCCSRDAISTFASTKKLSAGKVNSESSNVRYCCTTNVHGQHIDVASLKFKTGMAKSSVFQSVSSTCVYASTVSSPNGLSWIFDKLSALDKALQKLTA